MTVETELVTWCCPKCSTAYRCSCEGNPNIPPEEAVYCPKCVPSNVWQVIPEGEIVPMHTRCARVLGIVGFPEQIREDLDVLGAGPYNGQLIVWVPGVDMCAGTVSQASDIDTLMNLLPIDGYRRAGLASQLWVGIKCFPPQIERFSAEELQRRFPDLHHYNIKQGV